MTKLAYISVRVGGTTGSCALVGSGDINTVADLPVTVGWSVRLTSTNNAGSSTKTITNYILVTQPLPQSHLLGSGSIATSGTADRHASTSLVGTGTIFTTRAPRGTTSLVGTGTITTSGSVHISASGGWGSNWGSSWGIGSAGVSLIGTGTITTIATGHSAFTDSSSTVGTGTITTSATAIRTASTALVASGAITTASRVGFQTSTSTVGNGVITTIGGSIATGNFVFFTAVGLITTRNAKLKARASVSLIGTGTITITPPEHGNLTEFPVFTHDLTEFPDSGGTLVGSGTGAAKNLSEIPA